MTQDVATVHSFRKTFSLTAYIQNWNQNIFIFIIYPTIACISQTCPPGSECRVCNATGEAYCVYSCAIDNGGCDEGKQCLQMDMPTCNPDQCCSPVNITCSGMQL